MSEGFLGRWSRRKLDAREGKPAPEDAGQARRPVDTTTASPPGSPSATRSTEGGGAAAGVPGGSLTPPAAGAGTPPSHPGVAAQDPPPALPTLDDVGSLTPESDFRPFVQRAVDPQVRNAAMKRLFSDPHFNVMDKLDVYVDDYSQPDPLPLAMVRQMASARVLGLAEEAPQPAAARDDADDPAGGSVAQSPSVPTEAAAPPPEDADPDLRLQQDDAPGPEGPGAGAR